MKLLVLGILLIGSFASAGIEIGEKFLLPNTTYVNAGQTIAISGTVNQGQTVLTRTNTGAKTFYLNSFSVEGFFSTISATATRLGWCSLQIPAGTTVETFNLFNNTSSSVDRFVITPAWPLVVTKSFAFYCVNNSSTSIYWGVNYNGWEY